MENKDFLGTEPIGKLLFKLAVPTVIAQIINMLYNIVDRIYIGHMPGNGSLALTGVGVCMPIILIVSAFAALVSSGGSPRASISMGEGNYDKAENILGNCFALQIVISIVLTIILLVFGRRFLLAFGASENTIEYAVSYMRIYALGTIFVELTLGMNTFITAQGFAKTGMLTVLIGAVCNIILDPIMIFGLCGCPAMGIKGAAIATVIGQMAGAVAALLFNRFKNPLIHVHLKGYRFNRQDVFDIYRVGLPTIIMQTIGSIMTFVVNSILLDVSTTAVAFFGIYYKLQNFLMMPINGLGQATIPIVGYNFGSKSFDRVQQTWKILLPTGIVIALCGTIIFCIFPEQLLLLFSASPEMLSLGIPALRIISISFVFGAITILCGYFSSGLGNGVINMVGSAIRQLVVLVPCLYILIKEMGISYSWYAFWIAEVIACAYSYLSSRKLKTIL